MTLAEILSAELSRSFTATPAPVVAARLFAAMMLGGLIGVEREMRDRPAGLRTHILVSVAACLFALISFEIMALSEGRADVKATDPLRLIEAVTAGVAFLAAGTIFTAKGSVQGLTTGAGLWMAGAVGLSCGIGQYALAAMAAIGTLVVLSVLGVMTGQIKPDHG